ncbi:hypothetical protein BS17DRAFT_721660 [Gyrodon lividus]|nr:hypothetical protein BS17DRAFT_721660 [Gyrodon lividus]
MTKPIHFLSLVVWLCLATAPSRTVAQLETSTNYRDLDSRGHNSGYTHGRGYEKRKRGGPNSLSKRCGQSHLASISTAPEPCSTSSWAPESAHAISPRKSVPVVRSASKKWGLAWPNGDAAYLSNFARPKVRYLYTWSPYLPSKTAELGLVSIPMLWGWNQVEDFKRLVVQGYATHVLGMNEPNEPSQSNMSPQDGASLWKQYIDPLKYQGYYLISPACTNDQAGLDWMAAFVDACGDCTIDAVAFHFYGTDHGAFVEHATTLHNTYDKPIWITEFADQNFSGSGGQASIAEIYAFQSEVIAFVEQTPWVEASFPFGVMHDLQGVNEANALLTEDGWPTSLAYNYFG